MCWRGPRPLTSAARRPAQFLRGAWLDQLAWLRNGTMSVRQVGHDGDQLTRVDRFWHVHLKTGRQRAYAIFDSGVGGQRDGWNIPTAIGGALAYLLDQLVPIVLRHAEIRHERIRNGVFESFERLAG